MIIHRRRAHQSEIRCKCLATSQFASCFCIQFQVFIEVGTEPCSLNVFGQSIFFVFCVSAPGKEDNGCFICAKYGPAMHRCHFRTSLPEWSKWSKPVMLRISLQFDTGHFVHFVRQDCPRTVSWSRQRFLMLRTRRRSDIQAFSSTSWREGCTNYISDTGGAVGMVCVKLHL